MQYHIAALLAAFISAPQLPGPIMEQQPISITLRCTDNPACIFSAGDMYIEMTIKNETSYEVGVPIKYLKKKGPFYKLTDNVTQERIALRTGLASPELMEDLTTLPPGESFVITAVLHDGGLRRLRREFVDLTAELGLSFKLQLRDKPEKIKFSGSGKIRIIGKDTLERDAGIKQTQ